MWMQAVAETGGRFILGMFPVQNTFAEGTLPAAYIVKSIMYGSLDAMTTPLEPTTRPVSTLVIILDRMPAR